MSLSKEQYIDGYKYECYTLESLYWGMTDNIDPSSGDFITLTLSVLNRNFTSFSESSFSFVYLSGFLKDSCKIDNANFMSQSLSFLGSNHTDIEDRKINIAGSDANVAITIHLRFDVPLQKWSIINMKTISLPHN